jgi:hypothetical protein
MHADKIAPAVAGALLVHGGWHGAWCWRDIVDVLTRCGIECATVDLGSSGPDPHSLGDLYGDIALVRSELDSMRAQ